MDLTLFVTTLEFLDDPEGALAEAVRVARQGLLVIALNRWSTGGISRRWGRQARQPFLGRARDHSLFSLRVAVEKAAGERLEQIRWTSTLFPARLWRIRGPVPFGEVIGMAAALCSLQYSASE